MFDFGTPWYIKIKKGWENFYKMFTVTLKCGDEFNANFVLLYLSSYSSLKM